MIEYASTHMGVCMCMCVWVSIVVYSGCVWKVEFSLIEIYVRRSQHANLYVCIGFVCVCVCKYVFNKMLF